MLFYPGEVFNVGATLPVASVRLERFLSGMQVYVPQVLTSLIGLLIRYYAVMSCLSCLVTLLHDRIMNTYSCIHPCMGDIKPFLC